MAKLANYVRRSAFFAMGAGVLGLWGLQLLFAYLGEIENLNESYKVMDALTFIAYRSPYFLSQFMPTGVLLGAVVGLGLLANNSELVVMRSAGVSIYRIVGWALQPALLFVALSLSVNQWVLPISQAYAKTLKAPDKVLSIDGYWAVVPSQTATATHEIVYIGKADIDGNLQSVKRFGLQDGAVKFAMGASGGQYVGTTNSRYDWQLTDIHQVQLNGTTSKITPSDQEILTLPIAKDSVLLLTREPDDMAMSELYAHSKLMAHQGTNSPRHTLAFWQKVLSPFAVLSLVLVACSFVFGSLRSQSLGLRIVVALLVGLLFSYAQDLVGFVALASGFSPLIMVLLPILGVAVLGLVLIARKG